MRHNSFCATKEGCVFDLWAPDRRDNRAFSMYAYYTSNSDRVEDDYDFEDDEDFELDE